MFTHAEREDLIWSIIEGENDEAENVDDATPFPSQCGATIDFDELVSTSMCESYFPIHHPRALRKLRRKWGEWGIAVSSTSAAYCCRNFKSVSLKSST